MSILQTINGMPFNAKKITDPATGVVTYDRLFVARDFARYFSSFIGNGIFPTPTDNLKVKAAGFMGLSILPGQCFINGYYGYSDNPLVLSIEAADGTNPRIDSVVLRLNLVTRTIDVQIIKGTPSSNPVPPPPERYGAGVSGNYYDLVRAHVTVGTGVTVITDAEIEDTGLDTNLCGIVAAVVTNIDTTGLFSQYQTYLNQQIAAWNVSKNQQEQAWSDQTSQQQNTWSTQMNTQQLNFDNRQTTIQAWFDSVKNDIVKLQSFYFYNWSELNNVEYKDYPKDSHGKFISTITSKVDDKLIARQTEWEEVLNTVKHFYTKLEVFEADGTTILKEKTKDEYKDVNGVYISEVV